jgi:hypothetical protein
MDKLKLYIVGESSGDFKSWSDDISWCLVYAETPEQAKELAGDWSSGCVTEVVVPPNPGVMYFHYPVEICW